MQTILFSCLVVYTLLLFVVMYFTSRKANNSTYFLGNRRSPWYVVAYGMIGASLSGVTMLSVPGYVMTTQFTYFGVVLGYMIGYAVIALVLLPLYYKLNLTSIYTYLDQRFGTASYRTGSFFFILSRLLGSALRMYLMIFVLQRFVFDAWNVPFWVPAVCFVVLILIYTFKGGIKTIVWTDTLQTTFFLVAVVLTVYFLLKGMNVSFGQAVKQVSDEGLTTMFNTDWRADNFFIKQILSGAFITITMTGLDQDMMQKNLSCRTLGQAQKNMFFFSGTLIFVNLLFLFLGALLISYANGKGIDISGLKTDEIYPYITFNHLGTISAVVFILGILAAGYSSADGTLTALTTVFYFDFLQVNKRTNLSEKRQIGIRRLIHVGFALVFLCVVLMFGRFHNDALIKIIFDIASYTYGPLLGLYAFGMFTRRQLRNERLVPLIAVLSPVVCFLLNRYSEQLFAGYRFGFELLILNGLLTFVGLWLNSRKRGEK